MGNDRSSESQYDKVGGQKRKKFYSKHKALESSQHFSHYKSSGILPDTHGQLTPASLTRSWLISNPYKMLWVSLLPTRMKKIQSKMMAINCHNIIH